MALFEGGHTECVPKTSSASKEVEIWSYHSVKGDAYKAALQVEVVRDVLPQLAISREANMRKRINDWRVFHRAGPNAWHDKYFMSFETVWKYIGVLISNRHRYTITLISPAGKAHRIVLDPLKVTG
jgi:hypothetical protein